MARISALRGVVLAAFFCTLFSTGNVLAAPVTDSGSAPVTGGTAIANVAANDTVNGVPAILGAGGNATVSPSGAWPAGITLNTTTGAVVVAEGTTPGVYSVDYVLCDTIGPNCAAPMTDTVTVTAVIVPVAESGSAFSTGGTAIDNVAANDTVNGAVAILSGGGNATVATVGAWPAGITLNATTGAVLVGAGTAPGTYNVDYQLCDTIGPNCAAVTDTVVVVASGGLVAIDDAATTMINTTLNQVTSILDNDTGTNIFLDTVTGTTSCTIFPCAVMTAHGSVTVQADGTYVYIPAADYVGTDAFTYRIADNGGRFASATVHLTVVAADLVTSIACVPDPATVGLRVACSLTCTNSAGATAPASNVSCDFTGQLPSGAVRNGCPATATTLGIGASLSGCSLTFVPTAVGTVTLAGTGSAANESDATNNASTLVLAVNEPTMVPTMGEWGMIMFMILAGMGSSWLLRRRGRV